MTTVAKRARLSVTYVPGLECELDQALSDLLQRGGNKNLLRELVILGALAKKAGYTYSRDMAGRNVLVNLGDGSQVAMAHGATRGRAALPPAAPAPEIQAHAEGAANDPVPPMAGVPAPAHPCEQGSAIPAAPASAAKEVGRVHGQTASQKPAGASTAGDSATAAAGTRDARPVTVATRNQAPQTASIEDGNTALKVAASEETSATNPPKIATPDLAEVGEKAKAIADVSDSVSVKDLTPVSSGIAESAEPPVMSIEEGERLLEAALHMKF